MRTTTPKKIASLLALCLALTVFVTVPAAAQNFTWNGNGFNANWSVGENWNGDVAPSPEVFNGTLTFSGSSRLVNFNDIEGLSITNLVLNTSSWNISGNALQLFPSGNAIEIGAGLHSTIANDITVMTTGKTLQTGSTGAGSLTLSGSFNAGANEIRKDGTGSSVIFNGNGKTVTMGLFVVRKGFITFTNGVAATLSSLQIGNDGNQVGIVNVGGDDTSVHASASIETGRNTGSNEGRLNVSGGTVSANILLTGQNAGTLNTSGIYQSGGIIKANNLRAANNGPSMIQVSGGTMIITNGNESSTTYGLHQNGSSVLTISGDGEVIIGTGDNQKWNLAAGAASGTLNLNGGTLSVFGFTKMNASATTIINLDGGTLRSLGNAADWLNDLANTTVNVGNGGAVIDNNGFAITISEPLLNNGSGGLTKLGGGVLTLAGANTYVGDTVVSAGVLALTNGAAIADTSTLKIESGAQVQVDTAETVQGLYLAGVLQVAGTWGSSASGAANVNDTYFTGTEVLTVLNGATPNLTPTDITLAPDSITENNAFGALVGTFSTEDPNLGDTFTYTLVSGTGDTDNFRFSIDGDQLLAAETFSVDNDTDYSIRVRSTDQGGLSVEKTILVKIFAANVPTDIVLSSTSIGSNYVAPANLATLSAVDLDPGETFTFALASGAGDTDNASFSITGNQLSIIDQLPVGNYSIRIGVTDSTSEYFEKAVTITVNPAFIWSGTGPDNLWSTALNWVDNASPAGFVADLVFTNALQTDNYNDIVGLTTSGLKFSDPSPLDTNDVLIEFADWTVSGNPLTIAVPVSNGAGVHGSAGKTVVISNDITVAASPGANNRTTLFTTHWASNSVVVLSGNYDAGSAGGDVWKDGGGTTNSPSTLVFNGSGKMVTGRSLTVRKGAIVFENGVTANFTGADSTLGLDVPWHENSPSTDIRGEGTSVIFGNTLRVASQVSDSKLKISSGASLTVSNILMTGGGTFYRDRILLDGGTLNVGSAVIMGQAALADATNGWYQTGGNAYVTGAFRAGNNGPTTVEISGGLLLVTNPDGMHLAEKGSTTMTLGGSGVVQCGPAGQNRFLLVQDSGTAGEGTLNLNVGGTIRLTAFGRNNTTLPVTVNFNGGTLEFPSTSTTLIPDYANTTWNILSGLTVDVTAGGSAAVNGPLVAAGSGGLTKTGAGALLLNGANSYTGVTTVSAGKLGGIGTIAGNVVTAAGASVAPGTNDIGTLTINGNLSSGGGFAIEVNTSLGQSSDLLVVSGTLTQTGPGILTVSNLGPALVIGQKFYPFNGKVLTGGALLTVTSLDPSVGFINNLAVDGSIEVAPAAPVPAEITSTLVSGGAEIRLDWPAGQGWRLERQTNSLAVGLSANWVEVATEPPYTNAVNIAPSTFFRLVYP